MFAVYWMSAYDEPFAQVFPSDQLTEALALTEQLRRAGTHKFITLAADRIPGNVTKPGVDTVGPDYDWKKRR